MFAVAPWNCFHLQASETSLELEGKLDLKETGVSGIGSWGPYETQKWLCKAAGQERAHRLDE